MSLSSIAEATNFFNEISLPETITSRAGNVPETNDDGLISFMVAEETVPSETQQELDEQKQSLIDLAGVGNAYVRHQANTRKDPDLVYDVNLWQQVYNNLPLMGPSQFQSQQFSQRVRGLEIASAFIESILGFAVTQGASLAAFSSFLQTLGDKIRAGVKTGTQSYSLGSIAVALGTQKVGNKLEVNGYLKGYFIEFNQSMTTVYSSCASAESVNIDFSYRNAVSLFNYGALAKPDVRKKFDGFIQGTQIDDITNSENFFGGKFDKD